MTTYNTNKAVELLTRIQQEQEVLLATLGVRPEITKESIEEALPTNRFLVSNVVLSHQFFTYEEINGRSAWILSNSAALSFNVDRTSIKMENLLAFFADKGVTLQQIGFGYVSEVDLSEAEIDEDLNLTGETIKNQVVLLDEATRTAIDLRRTRVIADFNISAPKELKGKQLNKWKVDQEKFLKDVKANGFYLELTKPGQAKGQKVLTHVTYKSESPSQKRSGSAAFGSYGSDLDSFDLSIFMGTNLIRFAKMKEGKWCIDLLKAGGREDLLGSPAIGNIIAEYFKGLRATKLSDDLTVIENDHVRIAVIPDIYVEASTGAGALALNKEKNDRGFNNVVDVPDRKMVVQAFDGQTPIDYDFYIKLNKAAHGENWSTLDSTFRMDMGILKGAAFASKGLRANSGFDMIVNKGNMKLMPDYDQAFDASFAFVIKGTEGRKGDMRWTSHQELTVNNIDADALDPILEANVQAYLKTVQDFDYKEFDAMFGSVVESEYKEEGTLFSSTLVALRANPLFANDVKIALGIKKMLEWFKKRNQEGKLLVRSQFRIALQDPVFHSYIMTNNVKALLAQASGTLSLEEVVGSEDQPLCITDEIVSSYHATGAQVIEPYTAVTGKETPKKCLIGNHAIIRFPAGHSNQTHVIPFVWNQVYDKLLSQRVHRGSIMLSVFDLVMASLAGGDFDGDTVKIIFDETLNSAILASHSGKLAGERKIILDFAKVGDTVVGGCPWSITSKREFVLDAGFAMSDTNSTELQIDEALVASRPIEDIEASIYKARVQLFADSSVASEVGIMNNHIMRITESIKHLENCSQRFDWANKQLVSGTTLAEWTASAVLELKVLLLGFQYVLQYCLDEAKHGGAYREHLSHYLEAVNKQSLARGLRDFKLVKVGTQYDIEYVYDEFDRFVARNPKWLGGNRSLLTTVDMLAEKAHKAYEVVDHTSILDKLSTGHPIVAEAMDALQADPQMQIVVGAECAAIVKSYGGNVNRILTAKDKLLKEWKLTIRDKSSMIEAVSLLERRSSAAINDALRKASVQFLLLEEKLAHVDNVAGMIVRAVYHQTYAPKRMAENKRIYDVSHNLDDLKIGLSLLWEACQPQLLKAFGRSEHLYKRRSLVEENVEMVETALSQTAAVKLGLFVNPYDAQTIMITNEFGQAQPISDYVRPGAQIILQKVWECTEGQSYLLEDGSTYTTPASYKVRGQVSLLDNNGAAFPVGFIATESIPFLPFKSCQVVVKDMVMDESKGKYAYVVIQDYDVVQA